MRFALNRAAIVAGEIAGHQMFAYIVCQMYFIFEELVAF